MKGRVSLYSWFTHDLGYVSVGWGARQLCYFCIMTLGTLLVVHWLRFCSSNAGGMGLTSGWGIKILHVACCAPNFFLIKKMFMRQLGKCIMTFTNCNTTQV